MHTLIETYASDDEIDSLYPASCLLEDEDGIRILLVTDTIPADRWATAHARGAQAVVRTQPTQAFVIATNFMDNRTEDGSHFLLADEHWAEFSDEIPSFLDMQESRETAPTAPASSFVHLHCHSEYSALDGLSTTKEMVSAAVRDGQTAMAVTDHGNCAVHPDFQMICDENGVKSIFGMEAYLVNDRFAREDQFDYWHLVLWAMDDKGLRNLWAMSTEAYRDGLYGKNARLDWDTLEKFNEGVMCSTACLRGPVTQPYLNDDEDHARENLGKLMAIFGDRLYVELHTNNLPDQIKANNWLLSAALDYDLPFIAVCDSHYPHKEDAELHRVWMSIQTNREVDDESKLFDGHQDYHLMGEGEVREALDYLPAEVVDIAIATTAQVAERCTARIEKKGHNPVYSKKTKEQPDQLAHDVERLFDTCMERWAERVQGKSHSESVYLERFEKEFSMIAEKQFCGYFLMVWDIVSYAKNQGVMMSPARGSGGGSLVAYLLGINELDPVEYDILFERFMTKGRTELPDFDLDFPSSKKQMMLDYIAERWGADHMSAIGTHQRLKNKSTFNSVSGALKSRLPEDYYLDIKEINKIVDMTEADSAGLGVSWDVLMSKAEEELAPYKEKLPEVFFYADLLNHRLKTYGRHAAGVVIDPESSLTENLPMFLGSTGGLVAQFDKDALESLGYTKFDLLNLTNLDTLQIAKDLIEEHTGTKISPYEWTEEQLNDPEVMQQISDGWTLGMFQIGTHAGTRLCTQYQPTSIVELSHVITLVRPGPDRSGLKDLYLRRRATGEEITYPDPRMEEVLAPTMGTMIFQEQLMKLCILMAGYDDVQADKVRKILGKKKVEEAQKEGTIFIQRAIENGTEQEVAENLWEQMEAFAKYSFGFAHAMGYAMFAIWTAWFKVHYPLYFLCAALSTVDAEKIPDFVEEARRMGFKVLPPDINMSKRGFTIDPQAMAVRYGLESVKGLGPVAVDHLLAAQPFTDWEDFSERKGSKVNVAHIKVLNSIGAFESITHHRRWLEKKLELEAISGSGSCINRSELINEHDLPCSFDWTSLPIVVGRTGKPSKNQPKPPKKCTKACKQFVPIQPDKPEDVAEYTDDDIRMIEQETLGVYLSSTPFERIPQEDRELCATAEDVLTGESGYYLVAALIKAVRTKFDKNDHQMAFLTVSTERGDLPVTVFGSHWDELRDDLKVGTLCLMTINHNERGQTLSEFLSLDTEMEHVDA